MFLWRKRAEPRWVKAREELLEAQANGQLVIVRRPGRKRLELEIACRSKSDSSALLKKFGGRIEALARNWLKRYARTDSKPIKIGKRLVIVRFMNQPRHCSGRRPQRNSHRHAKPDALRTAHATADHSETALLIIPASLAFGTGEHATTAMSLRFFEQLTRGWKHRWSLVDLGTGSGILVLAAKCFRAGRVLGIDDDRTAILVAESNARLNQICGATFQLGDVRKWKLAQQPDVITANLYTDLLIEILPKLRGSAWLILSGILRSQQDELVSALLQNRFDIIRTKRRGKWMAFLARRCWL